MCRFLEPFLFTILCVVIDTNLESCIRGSYYSIKDTGFIIALKGLVLKDTRSTLIIIKSCKPGWDWEVKACHINDTSEHRIQIKYCIRSSLDAWIVHCDKRKDGTGRDWLTVLCWGKCRCLSAGSIRFMQWLQRDRND